MLHCVIMAGGLGTRFWPMSRRSLPKQFLTLTGERSLLQSAFDCAKLMVPDERVWVVTNERFVNETRNHLPTLSADHILLEPCSRNTAPCVGLAALCLASIDPDAIMLVMSADHLISPPEFFRQDVERATRLVQENPQRLVLFGVPPTYPATGFGYIERERPLDSHAFMVASFREKPDRATAEEYLRTGRFFWNCGIFVWRAARLLQLLQIHEPEIAHGLERLRPHLGRPTWNAALAEIFPQMKSISIDYAVLEREHEIAVLEATFNWDDIGSWEAMARINAADAAGNTVSGQFLGLDTTNCIVRSTAEHLVAAIGLKDCIIVHTPQATLVANRRDEEGIRRLIALIGERGIEEYL